MYVRANRMTTMLQGVLHAHRGDPDVRACKQNDDNVA